MVENKTKSVSKNNVEQRKEPSNNTNENAGKLSLITNYNWSITITINCN